MAIALNGSITLDASISAVSGRTLSHTVPAGSDQVLIFCVAIEDPENDRPSAVTFNSISMLLAVEISTAGDEVAQIWYLVNPTVTTANIVITTSGTMSDYCAAALNYTGVDTSNPLGNTTTAAATSATLSINLTRSVSTSLLLSCLSYMRGVAAAFTPVGGVTERVDQNDAIATANISQFVGERIEAAVGSFDVGATVAISDVWAGVAAEFLPLVIDDNVWTRVTPPRPMPSLNRARFAAALANLADIHTAGPEPEAFVSEMMAGLYWRWQGVRGVDLFHWAPFPPVRRNRPWMFRTMPPAVAPLSDGDNPATPVVGEDIDQSLRIGPKFRLSARPQNAIPSRGDFFSDEGPGGTDEAIYVGPKYKLPWRPARAIPGLADFFTDAGAGEGDRAFYVGPKYKLPWRPQRAIPGFDFYPSGGPGGTDSDWSFYRGPHWPPVKAPKAIPQGDLFAPFVDFTGDQDWSLYVGPKFKLPARPQRAIPGFDFYPDGGPGGTDQDWSLYVGPKYKLPRRPQRTIPELADFLTDLGAGENDHALYIGPKYKLPWRPSRAIPQGDLFPFGGTGGTDSDWALYVGPKFRLPWRVTRPIPQGDLFQAAVSTGEDFWPVLAIGPKFRVPWLVARHMPPLHDLFPSGGPGGTDSDWTLKIGPKYQLPRRPQWAIPGFDFVPGGGPGGTDADWSMRPTRLPWRPNLAALTRFILNIDLGSDCAPPWLPVDDSTTAWASVADAVTAYSPVDDAVTVFVAADDAVTVWSEPGESDTEWTETTGPVPFCE